jgi:hypothetical protein
MVDLVILETVEVQVPEVGLVVQAGRGEPALELVVTLVAEGQEEELAAVAEGNLPNI